MTLEFSILRTVVDPTATEKTTTAHDLSVGGISLFLYTDRIPAEHPHLVTLHDSTGTPEEVTPEHD